jgi:apolipoprotein D and lipocalin family protein
MKNLFSLFISLLTLLPASGSASGSAPPLNTVPYVDLSKYIGKWYEIASMPQSFSKGCVNAQATYSLREDGDIDVLNECTKEGKLDSAKGKAWVVDKTTNAKLKVRFFWPFSGDYWVIDLGKNYEYAVVGHPSRDYLWILSREPQMDERTYNEILKRLVDQQYDLSTLEKTRR